MATIQKRGDLQWRARVRRRGYPLQTKSSGDSKLDSHQMQPSSTYGARSPCPKPEISPALR